MAVRCMVHGRIYNPRIPRSGYWLGSNPSTATMPGNHAGRADSPYKRAQWGSIPRPGTKGP